jgi:predicted enzyme related to lactoylglutathione lyase|tara:strand:+ start:16505 stop:16930 length:426 start_codon:yes stop_codon:yes gene_type:complete
VLHEGNAVTTDIQKNAIDIGIITNNLEAMLSFYSETLALELEAVIDMPGGGVMNRFKVGDSIVKVIETDPQPSVEAAPGGIRAATGYRYWTIHVNNLVESVQKIEADGYKVVVPIREIRAGTTIAIVEDPDGNWVELLQNG